MCPIQLVLNKRAFKNNLLLINTKLKVFERAIWKTSRKEWVFVLPRRVLLRGQSCEVFTV
jgi:hypothetical protein